MQPFPSMLLRGGFTQLAATASPNTISGTGSNAGATTITTNATTVTPTGGNTPYTHAWSVVSGGFTITSPSAATTTASKSQAPGTSSGVIRDTITSADGQVTTVDVNVSVSNTYVAPQPPVWNVGDGTNMITMASGDPTQYVDFYAASPTASTVAYSTLGALDYGAGRYGPQPTWPQGVAVANNTGLLAGGSTADPGVYSGTYMATNTADHSQTPITITVTITA